MSDKKNEDDFDWTQALADWAQTTFAPEPAERKRSLAPTPRSRAPSIPNIDPSLLPDLTRRSAPPPPRVARDDEEPRTTEDVESETSEHLASAQSPPSEPPPPPPEPSTRTLYRSSASRMRSANVKSEPRLVPATPQTPIPPSPPSKPAPAKAAPSTPAAAAPAPGPLPRVRPPAQSASSFEETVIGVPAPANVRTEEAPISSAAPSAAAAAPAAPPSAPRSSPNNPPAASVRAGSAPGGGSTLGALLGGEPSDDELDALLLGFPSEVDDTAHTKELSTEIAKKHAESTRPTSPPPSDENVTTSLKGNGHPAAPSSASPSARERAKPEWPSDEEEPTAVRALPSAELNAMFAERSVEKSAPPPPAAEKAASDAPPAAAPSPDSVTVIRAAAPSAESFDGSEDAPTATKLPTPSAAMAPPKPAEVAAPAAPDSVTALRIATPRPTPPPSQPQSQPPKASAPPAVVAKEKSDEPPDSVTGLHRPTPIGGISPTSGEPPPPARAPAPSDEDVVVLTASEVDVSELPQLEELGPAEDAYDHDRDHDDATTAHIGELKAPWGQDREASAWLDPPAREAFAARATWLDDEARRTEDRAARARMLLVVSEIYALMGETELATARARDAREAAPQMGLPHRQLRSLTGTSDGGAFLEQIDLSIRNTPNLSAKMHDALLAADVLRIEGDEDGARKRYEQAARIGAQDARLVLARAGMALARNDTSSIALRVPDAEGLAPFARAATAALRLRGIEVRGAPAEGSAIESVRRARAALDKGDVANAAQAVLELGRDPALADAARWIAAALTSANDNPSEAAALVRSVPDVRAKRWLAARGLELGDPTMVAEALSSQDAFTPSEQLVLLLLSGASADDVRMTNSVVASMPDMAPLASAAAGLRTPLDGHVAGGTSARHEMHLGRLLASDAAPHAVASAVNELARDHGDEMRALVLDAAHAAARFADIADGIAAWGGDAPAVETMLAAALVAERGGDGNRARENYRKLAKEDPGSLVAMRALGDLDGQHDEAAALRARAQAIGTGVEAAVAEIELYARLGANDAGIAALERAAAADPTIAVPHLMLERAARQRGDLDRVVAALRGRRSVMTDPMEVALDGVREALLVADTEPERAGELLLEAHRARPDDVALRELYERLTIAPPAERAQWREARAAKGKGTARTLWMLEASQLYGIAGDTDSALRVAAQVAGSAPTGLARIALEDAELAAQSVSRLSDELLAQAKAAADAVDRREAYERLAEVDTVGHDASSAHLWQRSVLEESPDYLPSLRYLEHVLVEEARDDELDPIVSAIAKKLEGDRREGGEGVAHAAVAAWLRNRAGEQPGAVEMAEIARRHGPAPLWALRTWNADARMRGDARADYESTEALAERTQRTSEQVTLAMRMGDAALRLGRQDDAVRAYEHATTLDAGDVAAWQKLAEARRAKQDHAGAAEALEAAARISRVDTHRLAWWHEAAVLWSDGAHDDARARAALEQCAATDLAYADVFTRLSALYAKTGAKAELAELLERRSKAVSDDNERLAIEVERGRLLTEIGEPARARAALQAALTIQPDHAEALDALADLSVAAGEFTAAEQAWVRLARLLATPDEQRAVYHKLGTLYADHLGNLSRAELAFREVLKRTPGHVPTLERLVTIYSKQNDAARALEIQNELVATAKDPAERRDRLIGLSRIYETTSRDLRKAEQALESARRELPQDVALLRALAEFYTRHRQMPAVHILLDRTAGDVRRALGAGRFHPAAFEIMTAVYELRGHQDAAALVGASLAAIEGRPAQLAGAEARAGNPALDDLLAPELVSPALRAILSRSGEALDVLAPVDLKGLRAAALPPSHPIVALASAIGQGMGVSGIQVHVSPQLGMMCVPVSTTPPAVVVGEAVVQSANAAARGFLFVRALKLVQARCGALVRIPPKDAAAAIGGYFRVFNPTWEPPGVPPALVNEAMRRLQAAMPRRSDPDTGLLALEAAGPLFQQPHAVSPALLAWANRAALLAVGDPNAALDAMAWSAGMTGGAPSGDARTSWIARTPEARELLVFSLSDAYAEARKRCGLASKK